MKKLIKAIEQDNPEEFMRLWKVEAHPLFFNINARIEDNFEKVTFLHIAARSGALNMFEGLIKDGVDVNAKVTCMYSWYKHEKSFIRHVSENEGATPLYMATSNGHLEMVKQLIKKGADVNAALTDGRTSLWTASRSGHLEVVKTLIEKGADVNAAISSGRFADTTSLYIAAQNGHLEVVKQLIKKGADVDAVHTKGATSLYIAAQNGHLEVVKQLIKKGADVNAAISSGRFAGTTSLYIAAQNGHLEVVKQLIKKGADVTSGESAGRTSIVAAIRNNHYGCVAIIASNSQALDKENFNLLVKHKKNIYKAIDSIADTREREALLKQSMETEGDFDFISTPVPTNLLSKIMFADSNPFNTTKKSERSVTYKYTNTVKEKIYPTLYPESKIFQNNKNTFKWEKLKRVTKKKTSGWSTAASTTQEDDGHLNPASKLIGDLNL